MTGGDSATGGINSDRVVKRFGRRTALKSVSFWAPPGMITLLAGRNGAGKTTWVRVAVGLARPSGGGVRFAGQRVGGARESLAFVPDEPPVYGRLSGYANLRCLSNRRRPSAARMAEVREMLALDDSLMRQRTKGYSLGQRRRLAIGCALLREPRYLFLDEPTIGLDPVAWAAVREALRGCAARGTTVLLTGQDFGELETIFDRIAILADGVIAFEGDGTSLLHRRPPRVRVAMARPHGLGLRIDRPWTRVDSSTLEFSCRDEYDARQTLNRIRELGGEFTELGIKYDTLEEAFLALHAELEGGSHALPS